MTTDSEPDTMSVLEDVMSESKVPGHYKKLPIRPIEITLGHTAQPAPVGRYEVKVGDYDPRDVMQDPQIILSLMVGKGPNGATVKLSPEDALKLAGCLMDAAHDAQTAALPRDW